jgi:MFS family permease
MLQRMFAGKNSASFRLSAANVIMVANAFIWYFLAFTALKELLGKLNESSITTNTLMVFGVNLGAIAFSGLLGSFLVDKFKKRKRFLFIWIAIGVAISLVPLGLNVLDINYLTVISLIFGFYFGLGMPATMGYHSSLVGVEGRAKTGGLTFLIIGATSAIAGVIISDNVIVTCLVLAFVRVIGLTFFHFMSGKEKQYSETSKVNFRNIIANKSFIFYFIPWLMITLINYMTLPILRADSSINYDSLSSSEYIIVALAAVLSGFVADRWGRKRLTIIGFVLLGIGYAVIGLTNNTDYTFLGLITYTVTDGIAWGIFNVLFLFTLWGDLAHDRNSDKFYFLGALPFLSSYVIQLVFGPVLSGIPIGTIFSFASVFLFLGVLPLIYAPETLPEKLMKDRDLKSYVENAKKRAQKESGKINEKEKLQDTTQKEAQETKNSSEYDEAAKLAEKYY